VFEVVVEGVAKCDIAVHNFLIGIVIIFIIEPARLQKVLINFSINVGLVGL